jgi:hypothetical protein
MGAIMAKKTISSLKIHLQTTDTPIGESGGNKGLQDGFIGFIFMFFVQF